MLILTQDRSELTEVGTEIYLEYCSENDDFTIINETNDNATTLGIYKHEEYSKAIMTTIYDALAGNRRAYKMPSYDSYEKKHECITPFD